MMAFCRTLRRFSQIRGPITSALGANYGTKVERFTNSTVDPEEVAKFAEQAAKWWRLDGAAAPLHRLNPVRLSYIRSAIERNVTSSTLSRARVAELIRKPLSGFDIIDVGCGGGLVTEPLTRLGANVLGIDMSNASIEVARRHAAWDHFLASSSCLKYDVCSAADVVKRGETFDVVLALEVVEHVPDLPGFLKELSSLVRPGGSLILSTINRTAASYALAIIAAENILRWLPRGTHKWSRFVRPDEISAVLASHTPLRTRDISGIAYNPFSNRFSIVSDTSVNYMLTAIHRPGDVPAERPFPPRPV